MALRIEESQRDGSKHHVIELTTKSSDLGNLKKYEEKYCTVYDSFFKFTIDLEDLAQADSAAAAQGFAATPSASGVASSVTGASPSTKGDDKNFMVVQRPIVHPLFRNCNYVNAAVELQNAKAGSCIIRPASASPPPYVSIFLRF